MKKYLLLLSLLAPLLLGSSSAVRYSDTGNLGGYQGSDWATFTMVPTASSNPTKGTTAVDLARWRRAGDSIEVAWDYAQTSGGADGSGGTYYKFPLPGGCVIDTTKQPVSSDGRTVVGVGKWASSSDGNGASGSTIAVPFFIHALDTGNLGASLPNNGSATSTIPSVLPFGPGNYTFSGTRIFSFLAKVPCVGWTSTTPNGTALNSEVDVYNSGGQGSTNDKAVIFSTVLTNTGTDVTYATSATLADTFTVNTTGVYAITYCVYASTNQSFAISINGSGTTAAGSLVVANVLNSMNIAGNLPTCIPYFGTIAAGSVLRAHTPGTMATSDTRIRFHIVRIR